MKSLIRNDLRWAWPLTLLGTLLHLAVQIGEHTVGQVWILPVNKYVEVSLGFHAVAAMMVGVWALLLDDLFRTREYRRHRPQSDRRLFWARHLVGLAVVASWVLLVPTLHLLGSMRFSPDAPLIEAGRWWLLVVQGAPAFFHYALAVLVASCARTMVGGALLAAAVGGVLFRPIWLAVVEGPPWAVATTLALSFLLAPLLLAFAERSQRLAPDPDRPWDQRHVAGAGTALVVLAATTAALLLTFIQLASRLILMARYPNIVETDRGAALARTLYDENAFLRVDERHRPQEVLRGQRRVLFDPDDLHLGVPAPAKEDHPVWRAPSSGPGQLGYGVSRAGGRVFRSLPLGRMWSFGRLAYMGQDGYIYVYWLARRRGMGDDRPRTWRLGKGSGEMPFSARAQVLNVREPDTLLAEDGQLWFLQSSGDAPALVPAALPDQDRFVRLERIEPGGLSVRDGMLTRPPLVVRGERGRYLWHDDRFLAIDPARPPEALRGYQIYEPGPPIDARPVGATGLQVSLRAPDGTTFQHLYQPHTRMEVAMAIGMRGSTLLRPLLTTLPALFAGTDWSARLGPALLLDRAVLLGDWPALAGNLLVSLVLAAATFRRVGRLGAPRARRGYWAAAVLLGGVPAFLCHLLIERRRAWQPMPAEPQGRPAPAGLLLQTAA